VDVHRRLTVRVAVVLALAGAWLLAGVGTGVSYAAPANNLLTNGDFEGSGSGSLAGWSTSNATASLAGDGVGGGYAARVAASTAGSVSFSTSAKVVKGVPAGEGFRATGMVRSDTPGKSVCLRITEQNSAGSTVATPQQCISTGTGWTAFPALDMTVATTGDSLSLMVRQPSAKAGDSFEVDSLSLADVDVTAPTTPTGVHAAASSSSQVVVSWDPSTDTDYSGVAGYTIYRNGSTTPLATVNATANSYQDSSVAAGTSYSYTVAAFDYAQNTSAASTPTTVTTLPAPLQIDDVWHMDETAGTTMVDSGQTPHPGVIHNVVFGQPGDPAFPGTAYGFDGTSSAVDVGNSDYLNPGDRDFRIAFSLNTTTAPPKPPPGVDDDYDIFRKGNYPGTEYKLELQYTGEFSCEFRTLQADGSIKGYVIQPAIDVHDGQWHRITCSKEGGTMSVTIDGKAFTKNVTGSIANSYHLVIGAHAPTGGEHYQGLLDDVRFHIG
jgi:hypothetical protein